MAIPQQSDLVVPLIAPNTATQATNALLYGYLDTLGFDHASIIYLPNVGTATGCAAKALYVTEGTNSTAASAIVALRGGTATSASVAFVVGNLNTDVSTAVVLDIDLLKRERYLRVNVSPGEKGTLGVIAVLSRGKKQPSTPYTASTTLGYRVQQVIA